MKPYDLAPPEESGPPPGAELLLTEPLPEEVRASAEVRDAARIAVFEFAVPIRGREPVRPARLVRGDPPSPQALRAMCPVCSLELGAYPPALLEAIGVKHVLFCERLSYDGQPRHNVPDLLGATLYIDVGAGRDARAARHALHRSVRHLLDIELSGGQHAFERPEAEWEALNPPGFAYGGVPPPPSGSAPALDPAHFLTAEARASVAEDRAEVWAAMVLSGGGGPDGTPPDRWSPPLRAKADLLMRAAAQRFPALDGLWWQYVSSLGAERAAAQGGEPRRRDEGASCCSRDCLRPLVRSKGFWG